MKPGPISSHLDCCAEYTLDQMYVLFLGPVQTLEHLLLSWICSALEMTGSCKSTLHTVTGCSAAHLNQ